MRVKSITFSASAGRLPCKSTLHRYSSSWICTRECLSISRLRLQQLCPHLSPSSRAWQPPSILQGTAASVASSNPIKEPGSNVSSANDDDIEAESLVALDWPAVCAQVACFASTSLATELILGGQLAIGDSLAASELLLQQTLEAAHCKLTFDGVYDLRPLLAAVCNNRRLNPLQLNGVSSTLQAAQHLDIATKSAPHLAPLIQYDADQHGALIEAIEHVIHHEDARILDRASEHLAAVRMERRDNAAKLRTSFAEWARRLHQQGVSERAQVMVRRDRQCVAVKVGRQGELPKGSVTLGTSSSGSTLYMEPAPMVALNNTEARLAAAQQDEEDALLSVLSLQVADAATDIEAVLGGITALDVVSARARHAAWCGAARPAFVAESAAEAGSPVHVPGMRHPILLQKCLAPLPPLSIAEDACFDSNFMEPVRALTAEASQRQQAREAAGKGHSSSKDNGSSANAIAQPLRPVDLEVPRHSSVVVVTGPNTGGKTAALKALGLAAVMAKAGLFLPLAPGSPTQPSLLWFDKVLADVGDGQSLQQSLSTFSAHVRRLRLILAAATPASLVLLDEVGSGTDPAEGEALAAALLHRFSEVARLTFATTHHAGLKDIPDPRFVNAAVEFDLATLKPTYRLLWGQAGQSNALAIAEGLGFSPSVVQAARQVASNMRALTDPQARSEQMSEHLDEQAVSAKAAARNAKAERAAAGAARDALRQEVKQLRQDKAEARSAPPAAADVIKATLEELRHLEAKVKARQLAGPEALRQMDHLEKALEKAVSDSLSSEYSGPGDEGASYVPNIGDHVFIRSMNASATVLKVRSDGKVNVQTGTMQMLVDRHDVAPQPEGVKAATAARPPSERQQPASSTARAQQHVEQPPADVAMIQTAANTVDVRGRRVEEALSLVDQAINNCPWGMALAVVHGTGTGRLRAGVRQMLSRHTQVVRLKEDEASKGGCTWAILK